MEPTPLPPVLHGPRVILHKNDPALAEVVFRTVDEDRERLARFLPWVDLTLEVGDTLAYLRRTEEEWVLGQGFDYHLIRAADGQYLGNLGLHTISWAHARAEIGYWIAAAHEGRGYVTEAVATLEQAAFAAGFERLEIRCAPPNQRSAAVAARLGYLLEGVLHGDVIERGRRRDTMIFAKLRQP